MRAMYRYVLAIFGQAQRRQHVVKMFVSEWVAIWLKRAMYQDVKLDSTKKAALDDFWLAAWGKKISDRWHRLYLSINSVWDEAYIPDVIFASVIEPKMNDFHYSCFYSDKSLSERLYASVEGVLFPETVAISADGYFYDSSRNMCDRSSCLKLILEEPEFIIKPLVGGSSGRGIAFVRKDEAQADSHAARVRALCESFGASGFIVQRLLKPHPSYSNIYPDSINTLRVITFVADGRVRVAPVCLRVGQGGSEVDNIHAGGIVIGVTADGNLLDTGYELGYSDSKVTHRRHPDTGLSFRGYRVEGVNHVLESAVRMHGCTPRVGIISWDFMVDAVGNTVLVEANYLGQSVWFPQIAHGKPIFGSWTRSVLAHVRAK